MTNSTLIGWSSRWRVNSNSTTLGGQLDDRWRKHLSIKHCIQLTSATNDNMHLTFATEWMNDVEIFFFTHLFDWISLILNDVTKLIVIGTFFFFEIIKLKRRFQCVKCLFEVHWSTLNSTIWNRFDCHWSSKSYGSTASAYRNKSRIQPIKSSLFSIQWFIKKTMKRNNFTCKCLSIESFASFYFFLRFDIFNWFNTKLVFFLAHCTSTFIKTNMRDIDPKEIFIIERN